MNIGPYPLYGDGVGARCGTARTARLDDARARPSLRDGARTPGGPASRVGQHRARDADGKVVSRSCAQRRYFPMLTEAAAAGIFKTGCRSAEISPDPPPPRHANLEPEMIDSIALS